MGYQCELCDKFIKPNCKYKHFRPKTQKQCDKGKHMELTIENPYINGVDREFYAYIIKHNKEYDYYLFKNHLKLVFNDNQCSTYVKSK